MSETNFFENPNASSSNSGWGAGVGGLIGAAIGSNGGLFGGGNNRPAAVTPDQLQTAISTLQNQMGTEATQAQLDRIQNQISTSSNESTLVLGSGIAGVKDAVNASSSANALALCGLGHNVQAGFASVNQNILLQGAASRELALTQALEAERARATELRIALSEAKNAAGHTATQVLLNQVVNAGNSGNP